MQIKSNRAAHALCCKTALAVLICLLNAQSYLAVAQTRSARATVSIQASTSAGHISPLLYGQFIEFMFEGVKFGLHAELLRNRSFEEHPSVIGLSRGWERYPDDRDDDYALNFTWDDSAHYPEKPRPETGTIEHSLRVDAGDGVIRRHGIFQSRVPVRAGMEYEGYLWLKTTGYQGGVTVALESDVLGGPIYAEARLEPVSSDWQKYRFRLRPRVSDPLARFAIIIEGRGRIWLDQASLLPGDAVEGVRRDVFDRVKALRPAFIRWPGGNVAQDYRWLWGAGPRDERPNWTNLSWKNELESGDFGTAEFIALSRNVGAEPSLTVNVEGRGATAEEAAAWVEYCNGPATTKYGKLRAAHGHPQPFNVNLWEIGNEIWGNWVRGHSDADTYARNFNRYVADMRKVDPAIRLIGVGDNDMSWNRTVLRTAGANMDYLAIHHYYGRHEIAGDLRNLMARPLFYEHFYQQVAQLIREVSPQRKVRLAINEWGLDLPAEQQYSMLSALYGARLMNVFERTDGLVAMSAVSDLINGWPGGIIQASRHRVFVSPIYLVNQLYSETLGEERLSAEVVCPTFDSTREGKQVPYLDVVASRARNGQQLFVKAVNTDLTRALVTTINIQGARVRPQGEVATVNGATLESYNSFATPDAVRLTRKQFVAGATFEISLPPHSVSVLKLQLTR
jgi:alpha-N-arabinofuranosidase